MIKRKNISSPTSSGGVCQHPAYYNSLCVSCGEKLVVPIENKLLTNNSSQIDKKYDFTIAGGSQLKLSSVEVERIEQSKRQSLHSMRKLALILDIDHTLLHATPTSTLPTKAEMERYQLECIVVNSDDLSSKYYHLIKLRPGLLSFLEEINKKYQLSVYTNGTRTYAESVVKLIDPTGVLFRRRIMSRTDTPQPDSVLGGPTVNPCDKSLARLFVGDSAHMAVILDDREDVWKGPQGLQLLVVRPFIYFSDARDINNSSGMQPSAAVCAADAISLSGSRPGSVRRVMHDGPTSAVYGQVSGYRVSAQAHFDDQLEQSLAILNKLHADYYELYDAKISSSTAAAVSSSSSSSSTTINNNHANYNGTTVNGSSSNHSATASLSSSAASTAISLTDLRLESILSATKSRVLTGFSIVFSGVIPRTSNPVPQQHYFWQLAVSLGAEVTLDLTPQTTHLIASLSQVQPLPQQPASSSSAAAESCISSSDTADTTPAAAVPVTITQRGAKVSACVKRNEVFIVHSDWLLYCRYSLARANEKTFSMIPGVPSSLNDNNTPPLTSPPQSEEEKITSTTAVATNAIDLTGRDDTVVDIDGAKNNNGAEEEDGDEVTVVINAEGLVDIVEIKKTKKENSTIEHMNGVSSSNSKNGNNINGNNINGNNAKKRKSEEISSSSSSSVQDSHESADNLNNVNENNNDDNNSDSSDSEEDDGFGELFDSVLEQNKIIVNGSSSSNCSSSSSSSSSSIIDENRS